MDLVLCIEAYFGRLEDETVAAVQYADGSSYERMSATWADERTLPSEAELVAYWTETVKPRLDAEKLIIENTPSADERIASLEAMVTELAIMNGMLMAQLTGGE